MNLTLRLNIF